MFKPTALLGHITLSMKVNMYTYIYIRLYFSISISIYLYINLYISIYLFKLTALFGHITLGLLLRFTPLCTKRKDAGLTQYARRAVVVHGRWQRSGAVRYIPWGGAFC